MKSNYLTHKERLDCPSCRSQDIRIFHEIKNVPVNSVMNNYTSEAAAAFPRGDISLGFCGRCGFIYNTRFDPDLVRYTPECEESQGYSPTFNLFARKLAQDLVEKYSLYEKRIIEIGCGKGEFLAMICALGRNYGVGFDPAYIPGRGDNEDLQGNIEFVEDYYSEKYADYQGDMICCRMTLEHIFNTAELIGAIRRSIGHRRDTVVFFQVPDVTRIMKNCAFEDIYYEHCSYFSPGSLARLFRRFGFDVIELQTAYDGQYILLEAKPANHLRKIEHPFSKNIDTLTDLVIGFERTYPSVLHHWNTQLYRFKHKSKRVVIWGGGSKAVAFLHAIDVSTVIEYVVDINPFRQQTFMAGTGQRIVAPTFLKTYRPDVVIIMNAIYREEIQCELNRMGLKPFVTTLDNREELVD